MGLKFFLTVMAVCSLSAFHQGFHLGLANLNQEFMLDWVKNVRPYKDNDSAIFWSVAIAMLPGGAALGSLATTNKMGYKVMLLYSGLLTVISQLMLSLCREARSIALLIMGRFLMGISVGMCAGTGPIYISEISKESGRGRMLVWFQVFITCAMWLVEFMSAAKDSVSNDKFLGLVAVGIAVPLIGTIAIKYFPESPIYVLISEGNETKAYVNLVWFRGKGKDISAEFKDMIKARDAILTRRHEPSVNHLFRFSVLTCLMVVISEQLCGVSILICYSNLMFRDVGLDEIPAVAATLLMGFAMVFGVFCYLIFVEIVGRRILYLVSIGSLFIITLILTITLITAANGSKNPALKYVVFAFISFFALMYGAGVGPSRWLIMVEPFGYHARPLVASLVLFCSFSINCVLVLTFLLMKEKQRYYVFILFTICDLGFFIFGYFALTGKSAVEDDEDDEDD